jgi:WD40 repeat protein
MNLSERASDAANAYAAKKKEQLHRANLMRSERESKNKHDASLSTIQKRPFATGVDRNTGEIMTVGGLQVECKSYGDTTERVIIRRPQADIKVPSQKLSSVSYSSKFDRQENDDYHQRFEKGRISNGFLNPPRDPSGQEVDLSDRPILCSSTASDISRMEVIFGGADHALYSVNVNNKKVIKMYSKKYGHTDWVTAVCHLKDNRVISAGMDGKLCLWSSSDRSRCVDLVGGHTKSVSKVVSSSLSNIALSCGYDTNLVLWTFNENINNDSMKNLSISSSRMKASSSNESIAKSAILVGHSEPVVECALSGDSRAISGDRTGSIVLWDLPSNKPLKAISNGHRGSITAVVALDPGSGSGLYLTSGVDGMVRLWDEREAGVRASLMIPAHAGIVSPSVVAPSLNTVKKSIPGQRIVSNPGIYI